MRIIRTVVLISIGLAATGLVFAQARRDLPSVEIVVKKVPGGQNMACALGGKPCGGKVVRQISEEAGKYGVMVALAGPDGSLRCTTRSRQECQDDAVAVVVAAAKIVSARGVSN